MVLPKFDGVCVLKEPVDKWRNVNGHNLLQLMYQDPKRYAMPFQSNVQLTMLELHNKKTSKSIKLMERSIFSARYCFVENLYRSEVIEASEFEVLSQWFEYVVNSSDIDLEVDLVVYLRTEPEKALDRIKARGRGEENSIPLQYLQELHRLHDEWLLESKFKVPAPVVVINANQDKELMLAEYNKLESIIFNKSREKALVLKNNAKIILNEINENQVKENIKEKGKENQIKEKIKKNGKEN
ncbi:deoxynucleoside kinase [Eurytemora carolleeae]|uniref:deoxynucleoside kinase n=1 Tax=Eurytemora carolleeae TaxID=1294199 RepID=UPI000C769767|nr:deoxynucleoside kinase [Eurytemora carolleeae]|eukprot:XP_023333182.1 deoxynucleoside kinase-like [Eurytemora affinis]